MGSSRFAYSEKRSFLRMHVDTEVEYSVNGGKPSKGRCINLSATGMLLEVDGPIRPGDVLQVLIPSPRSEFASLSSEVEARRVEYLEDRKVAVGAEIRQMTR